MYSPEVALARDYLRRGLLIIPLMWLGMFGVTLWVMLWLVTDARIAPDAREAIVLHVTLTLVMGFGAAVAVFQSQGPLTRFYPRPVSALRLVACQFTLGLLTIGLMYATGAGLLNLMGVHWPILGPALFLATTLACSLAMVWTFEGTVTGQVLSCTATTVPLVIWFSRCYGARVMGDWHTMWRNPTALEVLTLGSISLAAFGVAVIGVQRTRRGDLFTFSALADAWRRYRASGSALATFPIPLAAQLWYERRAKFAVIPGLLLALFMLSTIIAWIAGYVPHNEVFGISLALPTVMLLVMVPMVYGLVAGNCGREARHPMQHFLATRPVTDAFLAGAILRNCAMALASAWAAWLVGLAILAGLLFLAGHGPDRLDQVMPAERGPPLAVCLAMPVISWIITGVMATLVATGRPKVWASGLSCLFLLFCGFVLLRQVVPPETYVVISNVWLAIVALGYLGATVTCYVVAVRRHMVRMPIAGAAFLGWIVFALTFVWLTHQHIPDVIWLAHLVAFSSLAMLPIAGLPLAVRWNRHR